jgi:transcription antitermination factor NusG
VTLALAERLAVTDEAPANDASLAGCYGNSAGWAVCRSNPQAERWADANLRLQGYQTYLPLYATKQRDRVLRTMWHQVEKPLFTGYLFVWLTRRDVWRPIRETPGVHSLLLCGNRLQYAHAGAVEALQAGEDLRRQPSPETSAWRVGASCAIGGGVFEGHEAVVMELRGQNAVVSLVAFGSLQRAVVAVSALTGRN